MHFEEMVNMSMEARAKNFGQVPPRLDKVVKSVMQVPPYDSSAIFDNKAQIETRIRLDPRELTVLSAIINE